MTERAITIFVLAIFFLLAGCESWDAYFQSRQPVSNRDPMMVYCKGVGLIRWDNEMLDYPAVQGTLRQIKIHNMARRQNCPGDKYPVWYYDEVGDRAPTTEKLTVTP